MLTGRSPMKRRRDDGEDHDSVRHKRSRYLRNEGPTSQPRFACPYFKMAPSRWHECSRQSWTSLHRLKEHLYRKHQSPPRCPLCFATFPTANDRDIHIRRSSCDRQPVPYDIEVEGMNSEQKTELKSRAGLSSKSDDQKCARLYQILFPNVRSDAIPSPYYQNPDSKDLNDTLSYIQQNLTGMLHKRLDEALERKENTRETIHKIVDDAVRASIEELMTRLQAPSPVQDVANDSNIELNGKVDVSVDENKCEDVQQVEWSRWSHSSTESILTPEPWPYDTSDPYSFVGNDHSTKDTFTIDEPVGMYQHDSSFSPVSFRSSEHSSAISFLAPDGSESTGESLFPKELDLEENSFFGNT